MGTKAAYSTEKTVGDAVAGISAQFGDTTPKVVIYFASACFDQEELARRMSAQFAGARVFGCSTAGEIITGKMLKHSVVAMALGDDVVDDVAVEVVEEIKTANHVPEVLKRFEAHYGASMAEMDPGKYVGIILADGLSGAEEKLMEKLGDLTDVPFIGGSAGDDLELSGTHVYAGGKAHRNAAVLALIKVKNGFDIIKTQSFRSLGRKLVATEVNEAAREVLEFNGIPAIEAYAQALGVPVAEASKHFFMHPIGLMVDGEPYVRSPQSTDGSKMAFYCNIRKGMQLELLEAADIIEDTRAIVESKLAADKVAGLINFHCVFRTLQLEQEGSCDAYGGLFTAVPTVGFSTYGEEYIGHMNQTSTMLLLK